MKRDLEGPEKLGCHFGSFFLTSHTKKERIIGVGKYSKDSVDVTYYLFFQGFFVGKFL